MIRWSSASCGAARRGGRPEFVRNAKLADVAVRKKLAEGGKAAIETCDDPMIKLALAVDADARAVRKIARTRSRESRARTTH